MEVEPPTTKEIESKQDEEKKMLMVVVRKIIKAKKASIKLLKENCMANAKVLERNSKSVKDPDPLSSALANNSMKWPITVNMDRFEKIESLDKDEVANWDSRKHRRRVCKFSLVSKWIESSHEPKNNDVEVMKKMFGRNKERIESINTFNWQNVQYKVGAVSFERLSIQTNTTALNIPRELKDQAIAQVICGDHLIEYSEIPDEYKKEIRETISDCYLDNASVPNLINFLRSKLDRRIRILPSLPGMKKEFIDVSHVLVQPQYKAVDLSRFIGTEKGENHMVTLGSMSILRIYQQEKMSFRANRDVSLIKIGNTDFKVMLLDSEENIYIKSVKALMGVSITPELQHRNVTMSPYPATLQTQVQKHGFSGLEYIVYSGEEKVAFKHPHTRGLFVHDSSILLSIHMKKISPEITKSVLATIASFMKYNIEMYKIRSMKGLRNKIFHDVYQEPWKIVGATQNEWNLAMKRIHSGNEKDEVHCGCLHLVPAMDYVTSSPTTPTVQLDKVLNSNGQQILMIPQAPLNIWTEQMNTTHIKYFEFLHPTTALRRSIQHIMTNKNIYLRMAKEERWDPPHPKLLDYVDVYMRNSVSTTAKETINKMMGDKEEIDVFLFALLYSFAYEQYGGEMKAVEFVYNAKDEVSFLMNKGVVLRNPIDNFGTVYGHPLSVKPTRSDIGFLYNGLIPNFTFKTLPKMHYLERKSLAFLSRNKETIKTGTKFIVNVQGTDLVAVKEPFLALDTHQTLSRVINRTFIMKNDPDAITQILEQTKRKREDDVSLSEQGPSKKSKGDDEISIYGAISTSSSGSSL